MNAAAPTPAGALPELLLTPGEPAGIGPDLAVEIAQEVWPARLVAVADPALLAERARLLGMPLQLLPVSTEAHRPGTLQVLPVATSAAVNTGRLDAANAAYVLETLRIAADRCLASPSTALVTAPVHKGIINDAGIPFTGHTEYFAERCGGVTPVMMLVAGSLRVALATTHLPLHAVPAAITAGTLTTVLTTLHRDLQLKFGIVAPRIAVCGLNPHAGEGGHLGHEDQDVIAPVIARLNASGLRLRGPLPADTAFTPRALAEVDAVLAMYHDQGLPVLKHVGFGHAVNVTLGLPIIRTSVDHGTALELAGTGRADAGSLRAALRLALQLALNHSSAPATR